MCRCRPEIFAVPDEAGGGCAAAAGDGGEQWGDRSSTRRMPRIVAGLLEAVPGLTIVHQTGVRRLGGDAGGVCG